MSAHDAQLAVVVRWLQHLNDADPHALVEMAEEDIELDTLRGRLRGRDEILRFARRIRDGTSLSFHPERCFVRGDMIVLDLRTGVRKAGTELTDHYRRGALLVVRAERVARFSLFPGLQSALRSASFEESDEAELPDAWR